MIEDRVRVVGDSIVKLWGHFIMTSNLRLKTNYERNLLIAVIHYYKRSVKTFYIIETFLFVYPNPNRTKG